MYSLEQIHTDYINKHGRRTGKSVDALVDLIGKIMVTDNESFLLVVPWMSRSRHLMDEFGFLLREHYEEKPFYKDRYHWGIVGYTSIISVVTLDDYERSCKYVHHITTPTFDL